MKYFDKSIKEREGGPSQINICFNQSFNSESEVALHPVSVDLISIIMTQKWAFSAVSHICIYLGEIFTEINYV